MSLMRLYALLATLIPAAAASAAPVAPETVVIYSAGSLRGVVNALADEVAPGMNVKVEATFGGSGLLRERIEKSEKPDLFMSADLASPRKLATAGRTEVPAVMIARNRMCILARRTADVTPANLIARMLAPDVHIKTSTPGDDPSGDYAWAIFDRIEALHPGDGARLKDKARAMMSVKPAALAPGQNPYAALFASGQVDLAISYCSGAPQMQQHVPGLVSFPVPPQLDPHPVDGLAVLSAKPAALRLALFLLSEKGQEIVARAGLVPVR